MTTPVPRIADLLASARAAGLERIDAQRLLGHLLGRTRAWLIAHDEVPLDAATAAAWAALCVRHAAGEPMAYLTGAQGFHGLTLAVSPAVLIPRPDTETLVDWALEILATRAAGAAPPRVLDLGTGSGAIALAIRAACPVAEVWATDRSAAALAVARANAAALGLPVHFLEGDWWAALPARAAGAATDPGPRFDLVVANPPYIAPGDPHLPALRHEPLAALVAGDAGLADLATLVAGAPAHLVPGGWLLLEHGFDQADAVAQRLRGNGFGAVKSRRDLGGRPRCSGGQWRPAAS